MVLRSRTIADYVYILYSVETNRADKIRADEIVIYIYVEAVRCDNDCHLHLRGDNPMR